LEKRSIRDNSAIYSAILKYGHSNFHVNILEYCEPNLLLDREQFFIDVLQPKYNVCKVAGSRLGHKVSTETLEKLKLKPGSIPTIVMDIRDFSKKEYFSRKMAAENLNVNVRTIYKFIKSGNIFKDTYIISTGKTNKLV
jgi:hypothetical protein